MPDVLSASIGSRRFNTGLIEIAGLSSVVLALIGVYSITAFSMERRTREIGIRLALGAQSMGVIRSVLAGEWSAIAIGLAAVIVDAVLIFFFSSFQRLASALDTPLLSRSSVH